MAIFRQTTLLATFAAATLLSACQAASPTVVTTPSKSAGPTPVRASPTGTTQSLLACPAAQPLTSLTVLARTDISPDDLLAMPDGTLWVSDPDSGHIEHIAADGHVLTGIIDTQAPEGMVAVGAGIVLAEQRTNRLVGFVPPNTTRSTLLTLPPRGAADGVDGIGFDATSGLLLIPDSPHGTLLSVTVDGTVVRTLATGLGRDVAATSGPDGAIWVAVEGSRGLRRVPGAGGTATPVGGRDLTQLDDVITVGSLLYATSLTTNDVVAIDPVTGTDRVLVTGGHSLQGLALLSDGRLALADSTTRVIASFAPC